ncbi:hypothetical protein [Lactiplantibacillus paraplantarum]|uniref:hypothetical protein n=1 Tax=Lactiplantibacillus paraplantarum TaxID=60520 RepID=UPI0023AAC262|nr:hypothetical protein [Lactiplantibacillus paraplantarum]WEE36058.1 hypothetical protein PWO93_00260 [Lactiplantibacillus paraplantarum]
MFEDAKLDKAGLKSGLLKLQQAEKIKVSPSVAMLNAAISKLGDLDISHFLQLVIDVVQLSTNKNVQRVKWKV